MPIYKALKETCFKKFATFSTKAYLFEKQGGFILLLTLNNN